MSRTLHVIDQPGPAAEAAVLRLSVDAATRENPGQAEQHVWLLFGGQTMRDAARTVGLRDDQFRLLPRPAGVHTFLPASLKKPKQLLSQAHRVICWTEGATQIASLLGCATVVRRVHHATLCSTAQRIITQARQSNAPLPHEGRAVLRQQWGVEPDTTVVVLIADRLEHIDASSAMMTIALAHEALRASQPGRADVRLLCHPLARRRAEATELSELLKFDRLLIQDAAVHYPWDVLRGCDVALAPCPGEAGLSILWAETMGLPIIAPMDDRLLMLETLKQTVQSRCRRPRALADVLTHWVSTQHTASIPC